jgi:hypothetical protein
MQVPLRFVISAAIVKNVIGELLYDPEDPLELSRERALGMFQPVSQGDPEGLQPITEYFLKVRSPEQFYLAVGYMAHGISYRQAAAIFVL